MDLISATIRLQEDKSGTVNTVHKTGLTPAEVQVLRYLHGPGAVENARVTGSVDRTSLQETLRLHRTYRPHVVEKVYPGVRPVLPENWGAVQREDEAIRQYQEEAMRGPDVPDIAGPLVEKTLKGGDGARHPTR